MKLLIDDKRHRDEYGADMISRTYDMGMNLLRTIPCEILYLDNDLGEGLDKCGWNLIKQAHEEKILPNTVVLVSGSLAGREIMGVWLAEFGYAEKERNVWEKKK